MLIQNNSSTFHLNSINSFVKIVQPNNDNSDDIPIILGLMQDIG